MAIRILPNTLVNQIAAGEVIERPAAVVRELVENAIDAGSDQIDIVIRNGGLNFISVTDNGKGMSADDLALAVERHATSKLKDDDLFGIATMGFRGEALPSIGSVARLTITSRTALDKNAWKIYIEGGTKHPVEPSAHPVGTTVEVADLFFATPVRLKFMKSEISERQAIVDVIERLALSFPHVGFKLSNDQKIVVSAPKGQSFAARVALILNEDDALQEAQKIENDYALHGFFATPALTASNAMQQHFIVNGRPIHDRGLSAVLRAAYLDVLPRDRYPVAVLAFTVPPQAVDMNVHPAKAEVRFRDLEKIKSLIIRAARDVLAQPVVAVVSNVTPLHFSARSSGQTIATSSVVQASPLVSGFAEKWAPMARLHEHPEAQPDQNYPLGTAIAQIFDTYILAQTKNGLILVDQHAAHERIVYERMKAALQAKNLETQGLLIPEIINVTTAEQDLLLGAADILQQLGFEIESFGPKGIAVRTVPAILGANANLQDLLRDVISVIKFEQDPAQLLERKLFDLCATLACYGSVRAGRTLTREEMNALLRQMEETKNSGQCNHGRPTFIQVTQDEIEKLFARR
jgi:DNA mismatch repair protein MutL